jgi:signal peptidase II
VAEHDIQAPRRARLIAWFFITAALAIALDQASKLLATGLLKPHEPHAVLGQALKFTLTFNPRGLFGISYGAAWVHYVVPALLVILLVYLGLRSRSVWMSVALGLVLGGGVANNLIDRVRLGAVIDFIDIGTRTWRWYTFNLADAFGIAGIIRVLAYEFLGWGRLRPAAGQSNSASSEPPSA